MPPIGLVHPNHQPTSPNISKTHSEPGNFPGTAWWRHSWNESAPWMIVEGKAGRVAYVWKHESEFRLYIKHIYKFHEQFLPTNSIPSVTTTGTFSIRIQGIKISRLRTSAMEKPWRAIHQGEIVAFWGWHLSRSMIYVSYYCILYTYERCIETISH